MPAAVDRYFVPALDEARPELFDEGLEPAIACGYSPRPDKRDTQERNPTLVISSTARPTLTPAAAAPAVGLSDSRARLPAATISRWAARTYFSLARAGRR